MTVRRLPIFLAALGGVLLGMGQARCDPPSVTLPPPQSGGPPAHHADPYVPPPARIPSTSPSSSGDELKAQVLRKLQRDFELADTEHAGSLTLAQADRAGLDLVARHFDQIDTQQTGRVTFEQVRNYLRSEGGKL